MEEECKWPLVHYSRLLFIYDQYIIGLKHMGKKEKQLVDIIEFNIRDPERAAKISLR
jgi:hypothetical protein